MPSPRFDTPSARAKLRPRHEPYYQKLIPGGYIGYRKTESGETWKARYRMEGKREYKTLGDLTEFTYRQAVAEAHAWFAQCDEGIVRSCTVEEACKDYQKTLVGNSARTCRQQFEKHIYKTKFGRTRLDELKPLDVKRFKEKLVTPKRKPISANRILRSFKAAMNMAYREGLVLNDRAWKVVPLYPKSESMMETQENAPRVFLDLKQRKILLDACPDDLKRFLQGLLITGARTHELMACRVSDLDLERKTLRLVKTKVGRRAHQERYFPITGHEEFFKEQARNKLPNAFLFTRACGLPWFSVNDKGETDTYWRPPMEEIVKPKLAKKLPPNACRAYNMRHTAIPDWLMAGMDIGTAAKLAGTSVKMIEDYYSKFIRSSVEDKLAGRKAF